MTVGQTPQDRVQDGLAPWHPGRPHPRCRVTRLINGRRVGAELESQPSKLPTKQCDAVKECLLQPLIRRRCAPCPAGCKTVLHRSIHAGVRSGLRERPLSMLSAVLQDRLAPRRPHQGLGWAREDGPCGWPTHADQPRPKLGTSCGQAARCARETAVPAVGLAVLRVVSRALQDRLAPSDVHRHKDPLVDARPDAATSQIAQDVAARPATPAGLLSVPDPGACGGRACLQRGSPAPWLAPPSGRAQSGCRASKRQGHCRPARKSLSLLARPPPCPERQELAFKNRPWISALITDLNPAPGPAAAPASATLPSTRARHHRAKEPAKRRRIRSMTEGHDCYQNALADRTFRPEASDVRRAGRPKPAR
jgi:hypothetical protein